MTDGQRWSGRAPSRTFCAMGDDVLLRVGRRCGGQVTASFVASNLVGAVFIFTFLTFIAPNEKVPGAGSALVDISIFVGYFIVVAIIGGTVGTRIGSRAIGWVFEQREPTEKERALTLSMVSRLT